MDDPETSELIAQAKAGDQEAFNSLVRLTQSRVHALAVKLTGNVHDADDVVQDVYVRAYRALGRFREESRFSTWLHRITANSASTLIGRRAKTNGRQSDFDSDRIVNLADWRSEHDPEQRAEARMIGARLASAVASLPQRLQIVVVLRHIEGMTHRQIADELDISEAAAKVRLHRAVAKLREILDRSEEDGNDAATKLESGPESRTA